MLCSCIVCGVEAGHIKLLDFSEMLYMLKEHSVSLYHRCHLQQCLFLSPFDLKAKRLSMRYTPAS